MAYRVKSGAECSDDKAAEPCRVAHSAVCVSGYIAKAELSTAPHPPLSKTTVTSGSECMADAWWHAAGLQ